MRSGQLSLLIYFTLIIGFPLLARLVLGRGRPRLAPVPPDVPIDSAVADQPLILYPAAPAKETLAVIISGDGGWARLSRVVAADLSRAGVSVIGIDARRYYWTARTPAGAARDLERVITHYQQAWGCSRFILIGYSRGAGVLPFLFNRLAPSVRERVSLVALLGLTRGISFHLRLREYLGSHFEVDEMPVAPELRQMAGVPLLNVYGRNEQDSFAATLTGPGIHTVGLNGGHHFGGDYDALAGLILEEAGLAPLRADATGDATTIHQPESSQ